jgi:hypothetical protein
MRLLFQQFIVLIASLFLGRVLVLGPNKIILTFQSVSASSLRRELSPGKPFVRLNKTDAVLLVVDHQLGLFQLVRDFAPDQFRRNIIAHAAIAKVFNLPIVLTTSAQTGMKVILASG